MRIPRHAQVQQIVYRLLGTLCGNRSFPHQPPQHLGDLKIEEMRSMHGFLVSVDSVLDALSCRCLQQPIQRGGRV